ncbi:MAG: imidazoleglycerol phosphate synthase glutamine amidotransferase subunit HisH [Pseudohongiellaceae bacterium]|jgi:imidazoleglycerol phosphate synthase glutamine amidotransferase subunit HisH
MAKSSIAVIDYGMGNLHSVASALEHFGENVDVIGENSGRRSCIVSWCGRNS